MKPIHKVKALLKNFRLIKSQAIKRQGASAKEDKKHIMQRHDSEHRYQESINASMRINNRRRVHNYSYQMKRVHKSILNGKKAKDNV